MTCTTCNDTRKVYNESWDTHHNCPDCSPVHHDTGPDRPVPVTISLYCASVQVVPTVNIDPPLQAIINDVDYDDILNQIPIAEVVRYYGAHNLLANMEAGDIKEYLQL